MRSNTADEETMRRTYPEPLINKSRLGSGGGFDDPRRARVGNDSAEEEDK